MMMGQQRSRLAALGIDLWVPKDALRQEKSCPSLWRDQSPEHPATHVDLAITTSVPVKKQEKRPPTLEVPVPARVEAAVVVEQRIIVPETTHSEQIAPFTLQACSLPHCVILLDATVLSEQQQRLWFNIQTALPSQFHELKWPFPLPHLQDSRGVQSYIQGFIDAMSLDKNLIMLGDIPYLQHSIRVALPSLEQMLQQPQFKQQLWHYMQNKPNSMDD